MAHMSISVPWHTRAIKADKADIDGQKQQQGITTAVISNPAELSGRMLLN